MSKSEMTARGKSFLEFLLLQEEDVGVIEVAGEDSVSVEMVQ